VGEGMAAADIFVGTKEEIMDALTHWLKPGDWILVKGSRSVKMETLIKDLLNNNTETHQTT
jgi:UDP-N-acetylmuramyl pentapeptide synthase